MNDHRFDEIIREAGKHYNEPPPVPKDEMWKEIEAKRSIRRIRPVRSLRPARWLMWPLAAAAVLVIIFSIRYWEFGTRAPIVAEAPVGVSADRTASVSPAAEGRERGPAPVSRFAATELLSRTETVLTQFRMADPQEGEDARVTRWAEDLLLETRLVMNNPAADDPELKILLEDLELTLAQIVQYGSIPTGGKRPPQERDLIESGMKEKNLFARIRGNIPGGSI